MRPRQDIAAFRKVSRLQWDVIAEAVSGAVDRYWVNDLDLSRAARVARRRAVTRLVARGILAPDTPRWRPDLPGWRLAVDLDTVRRAAEEALLRDRQAGRPDSDDWSATGPANALYALHGRRWDAEREALRDRGRKAWRTQQQKRRDARDARGPPMPSPAYVLSTAQSFLRQYRDEGLAGAALDARVVEELGRKDIWESVATAALDELRRRGLYDQD
jgi:hypothetical protein